MTRKNKRTVWKSYRRNEGRSGEAGRADAFYRQITESGQERGGTVLVFGCGNFTGYGGSGRAEPCPGRDPRV